MLLGLQLFAGILQSYIIFVWQRSSDTTSGSPRVMAELAGDFGKLRVPLPKSFNGEPSDWEDWSWNFKSYLAIFQPDSVDFLARSETSNTEILDAHFTGALPADEAANMRMFSRKLHYLLANLCTGSARLLVRQNEAGNGFETWHRLSQRFSLPCHFWLGFLSGSSTPKALNKTSMPGKLLRPIMNNRLALQFQTAYL